MSNPYEPPGITGQGSHESPPRRPSPWRWLRLVGVLAIGLLVATSRYYVVHAPALVLEPTRLFSILLCLGGMASVLVWPRWYTGVFAALALLGWFVLNPI